MQKNNTYEIAKKYLKDDTDFYDLFIDISNDEWDNLVSVIEQEENNEKK